MDTMSTTVNEALLYPMPRVHRKDYWSFIRLVAPSLSSPPGKVWTSSDAVSCYCTKCKTVFPFLVVSSNSVRSHMQMMHPLDLSGLERAQASKVVQKALSTKRHSQGLFLSPSKRAKVAKPAEKEMATRLFTEWVASCLRPLSITEDKELRFFLTYIQSIDGLYELPSRRTITERLRGYAQEMRVELKEIIRNSAEFYSLTTDIWTSRTTESYLALTIHFVTETFDLVSNTLEVISFPGIHTGRTITTKLDELTGQWGLDRARLAKIVRDNGSNIVRACDIMGVEHFGCVAHTLHLIVSGALTKSKEDVVEITVGGETQPEAMDNDVDEDEWCDDPDTELEAIGSLETEFTQLLDGFLSAAVRSEPSSVDFEADDSVDEGLLDGCLSTRTAAMVTNSMREAMASTRKHVASFRRIVNYFRRSAKGKAKLMSLQTVPSPRTVIGDVATRWNSTHAMIRRLLVLQPAVEAFVKHLGTPVGKIEFSDVSMKRPTGKMWFHIQCLDKLLVQFDGATRVLSGEKYPTITIVLPCLRLLEKKLQNKNIFAGLGHQGEPYYNAVLKRMHLVRRLFLLLVRKKFRDLPDDVKYCSLLDPKFSAGAFLSDEERENGKRFLINETLRLAGADVGEVDQEASYVAEEDEDDFVWELCGSSSQVDLEEDDGSSVPSLREQATAEVTLYLQIAPPPPLKKRRKNEKPDLGNALTWWKSQATNFPLLAAVARKYLGVTATSVSSERCFSSAGNVVTARRTRLSSTNVRDVVFVHSNLSDIVEETETNE